MRFLSCSRSALLLFLSALLCTGCATTNVDFRFSDLHRAPMNISLYPMAKYPEVALFQVDEENAISQKPADYGSYWGGVVALTIIPIAFFDLDYSGDISRMDAVRISMTHNLNTNGIVVSESPSGQDAWTMNIHVRKFEMTSHTLVLPLVIVNAMGPIQPGAHIHYQCEVGRGTRMADTNSYDIDYAADFAEPAKVDTHGGPRDSNQEATVELSDFLDKAMSECIVKSGLVDKIHLDQDEKYYALISKAKQQENSGNTREAFSTYLDAFRVFGSTSDTSHSDATFKEIIRLYNQLQGGVVTPEQVRQYDIQGVAAIRDNNLERAMVAYNNEVMEAPWVASAWYNAAMVRSSQKLYDLAIRDMKKYIDLATDPQKARTAQDKIYEWEALKH